MEEQFVLRVPPSVAVRIEQLLNDNASSTSEDNTLDLSFSGMRKKLEKVLERKKIHLRFDQLICAEDGRSGTFRFGNDRFPVSLMDLPCVLESYKTYDDQTLIKTADVGQIILVREEGDPAPEGTEYRHGITPPMRDARRRRFRREPDLNPELVQRVEKDLLAARGNAESSPSGPGADGQRGKAAAKPAPKLNAVPEENVMNGEEPERSDSDDTEDSMDPEN